MTGGTVAKLMKALVVAAVLCGPAGGTCAEVARPAAAGTGEAVAWVHLRGGQHVSFRAAGKQFPAQVGTPLLRTDVLEVPAGEFVVVKLRNGYVVKIDEDTTLAVSGIVSLDAPPTSESLAAQLDRTLTREERGRAERIAATQARLAGADSVAPQSSAPAPPAAEPMAAAPSAPPPPEPAKKTAAADRKSAPPPPALSRGLSSAVSDDAAEGAARSQSAGPGASPFSGVGVSPGGGGLGFSRGLGVSGGVGAGSRSLAAGAAASAAAGPAPPTGLVKLGELEVAGTLDKAAAARALKVGQNQLRACYQRGLQINPTLTGSLVLKLVVGADGNVAMVEIASSKIVTPIERCAVNAATHWLFPPTKGKRSGPTTVTVPISFALPAS